MKRIDITVWAALGAGLCAPACGAPRAAAPVTVPVASGVGAPTEAEGAAADAPLATVSVDVMPVGLTTIGATELDGAVYVLGGYAGTPHAYSRRDQSREFYRFDLVKHAWQSLPSVGPIQSAVLVNDGRYVYRVGGMVAKNDFGQPEDMHSLPDVERFDTQKNAWQPLAGLPAPRSSHQALIDGTTLYVIGGWTLKGGMYDSEYQQSLARCDLSAPRCEWTIEPMPFPVRAHGAAVFQRKLYVIGGLTPEGSTDAVHVYDLEARTWSEGPALPEGNMTACAAVFGGRLYANGGDGNIYRLTPDGSAWHVAGQLEFPRLFHAMIAAPSGLLALGGVPSASRGGRVRHVELASPTPPPAGVVWTLPAQTAAKNRQGAFLRGQHLYVFGGNNSLEQHDFEPQNFVSAARRLDFGALEWKPMADYPAQRQSMQALVGGSDDKPVALAVGGFGFAGGRTSSQPEVFGYDLEADRWSEPLARMPVARSQFGLVEWAGAAWVIGGLNFDAGRQGNEFRLPTAVLRADLAHPEAGFSEAGFELGESRRAFAGALLGDRYYMTGGLKEGFEPVTGCEVLDLKARTHTPLRCPSQHRLGGELVALGERLYLVGGSAAVEGGGERVPSTRIEAYEPATDQWTTVSDVLPFEDPKHLRAFAYRGRLLLYTAQSATPSVQVALLDPAALGSGTPHFEHVNVPTGP
ncbi:MAG TPA: kelch repeat-containing protein [Polyangiaceae bacterium]|nr:kelch repeat-containing protein [Polyangiaceae bacterium]